MVLPPSWQGIAAWTGYAASISGATIATVAGISKSSQTKRLIPKESRSAYALALLWVDYFNGRPTPETDKLDSLLGVEPVATGDLILAEVLQGFRNDKDYKTAKNLLTSLTVFNMLNTSIAVKSADNFRLLRKKGVTVRKTIDSIFDIRYKMYIAIDVDNKYSLVWVFISIRMFNADKRLRGHGPKALRGAGCPLASATSHLISSFCSSPRSFALSFLQILPRDNTLALSLTFGSAITWYRDFHPTSLVPCPAHTSRLSRAAEPRRSGGV